MTGQSPADFQARYNQRQSFESKTPFDDLTTEENVPPFSANPRHQTYNVDPHAMYTGQHHRNPSIPLSQSHSISKHSYGESSSHLPAYPPKPGDSQEVDDRTLWQRILPDSLACRSYVIVVLLQTIVDLAIEAELLIRVTKSLQSSGGTGGAHAKRMPVYLSIFALAHVFQLVMAIDSVINRNTLQFIALAIFNANLLLYSVVQITEVTEAIPGGSDAVSIRALTAAIVAVVALAEVAYIALGWKIYNEFGWKVYKFLGADRRMKKMYETYQIYDCLIKFDVFFWVGFSVQFIWLVLDENDWEYYVTIAALPLSIILLIEGHLAARHENKMMMITFISGCGGAMIYFVYKLVRVLQQKNVGVYFRTWKTLSIFSVIAILLLLATVTFAVITMRNFGRGLKDALARKETVKVPVPGNPHRRVASATLNRMSID